MSKRFIYVVAAIVAIAATTALVGCSGGTAGQTGSAGQPQASSTGQQPASSTGQPQASSTGQPPGTAVQACSVLTNVQVGSEFGATFAAGKQNTELNLVHNNLSSTRCSFESQLADGNPWTVSIIVDDYPTDTDAKAEMTDNRTTTSYTGDTLWAVTEMPGVGDDAIIQNLLTLGNTQENLVVRKGSVIYHFQDTIITGISDSAAARGHLVKLAHLVVG